MNAYRPHDLATLGFLLGLLAATLLIGFAISRLRSLRWARAASWALVVSATVAAEQLCVAEPAGFRMLAIIGALLFGMKAVVTVEAQADGTPRLSAGRWLAFAALWPGMRPGIFASAGGSPLPGAGALILMGLTRLALGTALVFLAWWSWPRLQGWSDVAGRVVATALLLPGLSLMLHFGAFPILAGLWRTVGVDARPLFRAPLLATSLGEFWGRRWNLAFSEMTTLGVYRPAASLVGRVPATGLAFLASGLLHELAISVPVRAGYGLPLLYFALHGGLVFVERALERSKRPINEPHWLGRVWALSWLALPLPILFHPWFLDGVVWPLADVGE
jgi:alginate O-acetyltransferase complex protein AlgI